MNIFKDIQIIKISINIYIDNTDYLSLVSHSIQLQYILKTIVITIRSNNADC